MGKKKAKNKTKHRIKKKKISVRWNSHKYFIHNHSYWFQPAQRLHSESPSSCKHAPLLTTETVPTVSSPTVGSGWQLCWHLEDALTSARPHMIRRKTFPKPSLLSSPTCLLLLKPVYCFVQFFSVQAPESEQTLWSGKQKPMSWAVIWWILANLMDAFSQLPCS